MHYLSPIPLCEGRPAGGACTAWHQDFCPPCFPGAVRNGTKKNWGLVRASPQKPNPVVKSVRLAAQHRLADSWREFRSRAEAGTVRNATPAPWELNVSFSCLGKSRRYTTDAQHGISPLSKIWLSRSQTSLSFASATSPGLSHRPWVGRKNSRPRPGQCPGNFSNCGIAPRRGSTSKTTVPRRTVNWVLPASAAASKVSQGVRFQPAKVCR